MSDTLVSVTSIKATAKGAAERYGWKPGDTHVFDSGLSAEAVEIQVGRASCFFTGNGDILTHSGRVLDLNALSQGSRANLLEVLQALVEE